MPHDKWYREYQERENVPVYKGISVADVYDLELGDWDRTGGRGAFLNLKGMEEMCDCQVHEIPPGQKLNPQRHLHESMVFVLSGSGLTTIGQDDSVTFEWNEGSLFHIPRNTRYIHTNSMENEPVRLLITTPLPMLYSMHQDHDIIWNPGPAGGWNFDQGDPYSTAGEIESQADEDDNIIYIDATFVTDVRKFDDLQVWPERGGGGRSVFFPFPDISMYSHVSEFQPGKYKKAHRHLSGANILILSGEGYSLLWTDENERTRVDWQPGSVLTPPSMWYHQHFNTSDERARYVVFHGPVKKTGVNNTGITDPLLPENQIEYHEEDPEIREQFRQELAENDAEFRMDDELYVE
jgi:quercetin dioxygenase-like cupin family protein